MRRPDTAPIAACGGVDDVAQPATPSLRLRWRDLVGRRLPAAGGDPTRPWPVRDDHCFARVLLDNACGRPWREVIHPPAWRNADARVLCEAIALGEAVLAGTADLHALNDRSLTMRGKQCRRQRPPKAEIEPTDGVP